MCEILFRGKRTDNCEGEWVEGFYVIIASENYFIFTGEIFLTQGSIGYKHFKVDPETVGRFTGLPDKNGTKIFEGDILKFYNGEEFSNYEVIWFENGYKVLMEGETEIQDDLDLFFCEHSEVIGNIHDNPELLEANNE